VVKEEEITKDKTDKPVQSVEEPEVKKEEVIKEEVKKDKTDKPVQSVEKPEVKKEEVKKEEVKKDKTDKPVQSGEEPEVKKEEVKKEEILEAMPNASLQPIKKPRTYSLKELRKMCLQYVSKPEVEINFSANKIKYSHKHSIKELTRRNKGFAAEGLAIHRVGRSIDFDVEVRNPKGFLFCAYPTNIKLNLTLGQEILIAKEVKKGTCRYANVVRHEQTHAQIARTAVEHYLPIIGKRFIEFVRKNAIAGRTSPIDHWRARAELHEKYYDIIDLLIKELYKKIDKENAKLDNDENYRYEYKLCW
ncbi:MAG: hypothetical protein IJW75_05620, partial [Alphaproteobacteria bacterium]|nr:hypothetical protein [Alphaproteobacteria bacterium]